MGDIIGSMYEFHNTKRTDFELFPEGSRFTDDSVMTLAMAGAIAACRYPIPDEIAEGCDSLLTDDLRDIKDRFCELIQQNREEFNHEQKSIS